MMDPRQYEAFSERFVLHKKGRRKITATTLESQGEGVLHRKIPNI